MSDENHFFVKRGEQIHGPFTASQINAGVKSKKLSSRDLISHEKSGPWTPIQSKISQQSKAAEESRQPSDDVLDWLSEANEEEARKEIDAWQQAEAKRKTFQQEVTEIELANYRAQEEIEAKADNVSSPSSGIVVSVIGHYAPNIDASFAATVTCENKTQEDIQALHIHVEFLANGLEVADWEQDAAVLRAGASRSWEIRNLFIRQYSKEEHDNFFDWEVLCKSAGLPIETNKGQFQITEVKPIPEKSCFVATACFQDGEHRTVDQLRVFRDKRLSKHSFGRDFIQWYYKHGPFLAEQVNKYPVLRPALKSALSIFVWLIEKLKIIN